MQVKRNGGLELILTKQYDLVALSIGESVKVNLKINNHDLDKIDLDKNDFIFEIQVKHYSQESPGVHYDLNENNLQINIKPPYNLKDLNNLTLEIKELKEKYKISYIKFKVI